MLFLLPVYFPLVDHGNWMVSGSVYLDRQPTKHITITVSLKENMIKLAAISEKVDCMLNIKTVSILI